MHELNYYSIGKILGGTMTPIKSPRFGNFGLLEVTAEATKELAIRQSDQTPTKFTYVQDSIVARAFEDVRHGAAPDAILWDRDLVQRFNSRCRDLGVDASDAILNRRLITIRKNKTRYEKHGIVISPTTQSEPHPSIVPQYAHAIEFALVRLRYRYGASIDDILLDPVLGSRFEQLASKLAPGLSAQDLRLGALYIRKTRYINRTELSKVEALHPALLERFWAPPISLSNLHAEDVPAKAGLIELKERNRYLYVSRNENVQAAAAQFQNAHAFDPVSNSFWKPNPDAITLQFISGKSVAGASISRWERRLIHDLEPVLNWPIIHKDAA